MKKVFWMGLLLTMSSTHLWAQCPTWCTSVTDVCCDENSTSVDFTLPCSITEIYVQFDAPGSDRVFGSLYDVSGGGSIWLGDFGDWDTYCNCTRVRVYNGGINAGHVLRFKVICLKCSENQASCDAGSVTVNFFTPTGNTCAPFCTGS